MSTYSEVQDAFNRANSYGASAASRASSFISALNASIYTPPTISVTWTSLTPPMLPEIPATPAMPEIRFTAPSGQPTALSIAEPTISIDDFTEAAPTLTLPAMPTLSYGTVPSVPAPGAVAVPDAPTIVMPADPVYLALSTVTFGGVDLHADWLTGLENIPTLGLVSPTPYSYTPGAEYASAMLDTLKAVLVERLTGGTGLTPAIEQAIWDRARSRETSAALANEAEVMRQSEAFGFQLPSGVLAAQLRESQQSYYDKLSTLSRDIAIKQAELEQENLKQAVATGMQLEGQLIDYSYKMEQLAFQTAKEYADNAIQIYNASIENYKALLNGYQTYAGAYKTIIEGEMAKVEVYKAELQAEQTKASINSSLVEQYKAKISAGMSQVEIYKSQISAANTLVQLEQTKISAAGEQVRAYVAQVNAETAKVEAYKAGVQAQSTLVEVYKTKAQAFSAKVGAQGEKARAELGRYNALQQAKASEWEGYKVKVQAESARISALGMQSSALLDGYKAATSAIVAEAGMHTQVWETQIKEYEAGQQIAVQAAKINNDAAMSANAARLDAAKVGAQVHAQLAASAYGMAHASASLSSGSSMGVSYSYSNDTASAAPTIASVG